MDRRCSGFWTVRKSFAKPSSSSPGSSRGEARDKASDAAQEALLSTQRAMLKLPPELRVEDVKIREAKDWPKAMARLDSAASALQDAIVAISKQASGNGREQSVASVNKALTETQQAMLAIPGYDSKN